MKAIQARRSEALKRMKLTQDREMSKLADAIKDRKHMEKTAPKNGEVLIKHGLLAGFCVKDQKASLDGHIAQLERNVAKRLRDMLHLESVIRDAEPGSVRYV
jgi:hypothetical protein